MVAERYFSGGLILIRKEDGWRAFLGNIKAEVLRDIEKSLDQNLPRSEIGFGEITRKPNLIEEFHQLLPDCMFKFPDYRPMKFVDESGDEIDDSAQKET
jgi:hypothetical protein